MSAPEPEGLTPDEREAALRKLVNGSLRTEGRLQAEIRTLREKLRVEQERNEKWLLRTLVRLLEEQECRDH